MKKIFGIMCLLLVSCFLFSGCANVYYSFIMNVDGSIKIGFEIDFNKTAIEQTGYTYQEVKDSAYEKLSAVMQNQQTKIFHYASSKLQLPSQCGIIADYGWYNQDVLYASLQFESREIYKNYNYYLNGGSNEDDEKDNTIKEEHFLYIKHITITQSPFKNIASENFIQDLLEYFDGSDGKEPIALDDVNYSYYYGAPTKKIYSNCNYCFNQSGVKMHGWNFDSNTINDDIQFYSIQIKPATWYILAIILTVIALCIMGIIIFIKHKNHPKTL